MSNSAARDDLGRGTGAWSATPTTNRCRELATEIHDHALQSIALCLLQTELAKRMWERGEPERALSELQGIAPELEATAEMLRSIMSELMAIAESRARSA